MVLSRSGSGPATISQFAYDALDRVQQHTDAYNKTVRYQYDAAGRLTSLTYPDGKVLTNRYDALDRLTEQVFQFSAQQAFTNSYAYDPMGRLIRRGYPNGIVQTNTFDVVGRLTGLAHAPLSPQPSKLNVAFGFAFDRNGNTIQSKAQGTFSWPLPTPRQEQARFTPAARLPQQQLPALSEVPQTAPVTQILPSPNRGRDIAQVNLRIWDAEGSPSLPELAYQLPETTAWSKGTIAAINGTAPRFVASQSAGRTDAPGELGCGARSRPGLHQHRYAACAGAGLRDDGRVVASGGLRRAELPGQ